MKRTRWNDDDKVWALKGEALVVWSNTLNEREGSERETRGRRAVSRILITRRRGRGRDCDCRDVVYC